MSETMRVRGWALLVTFDNGEQDYVCDGTGDRVSRFLRKYDAEQQARFLREGLDAGDRIHIIRYPSSTAGSVSRRELR